MEAIALNRLSKFYGASRGIIDVDLTVEEGEFFGFIGPNGAGKSTTIRTLLGLLHSTEGRGTIFGMDITEDQSKILACTGYLPAETAYYQGMRVRELLKLSAGLRQLDCTREAKELCSRLQLDPYARIDRLSFGNRKKVGIVCALQHRPRLLLLDEPTSGLDPLMQKAFFEILRERHEEGTTIFLSSHVLSEIQDHCERAAIIREGQIIACDRMSVLAQSSARRVRLRGKVNLEGLEGIRDLRQEQGSTTFLYSGPADALLRKLAGFHLEDVMITEPSLDEIFLHYYEKGRKKP